MVCSLFDWENWKMSALVCYVIYAIPFLALVAGFIIPPLLIHFISNQWPSSEQFFLICLAVILGAMLGSFVGYFVCPAKGQGEGEMNFLPGIYLYIGLLIGTAVASLLISYLMIDISILA